MRELMASFEALLHRDRPNSMVRLDNPASGPVVDLHPKLPIVTRAAQSRPNAARACRYLVTIASQINTLDIVLRAMEIAAELVRFDPKCLPDVVAVVPERIDDRIVVPYAKDVCKSQHWPVCE